MHATFRLASLPLLPALLLMTAGAVAQPATPSSTELFEKARAALAAGDTAGACKLFEDTRTQRATEPADAAGPSKGDIQFELAACYEKDGKREQAAKEFDEIAGAGGARADEAKTRAAALREKKEPASPANPAAAPPPPPPAGPTALPIVAPAPELKTVENTPPAVRVGDFMDTRLTWVLGDDDILHPTGQAQPLSPDTAIGDRKGYRLFFDNLNSRFAGRENLTHLALYKKLPAFVKGLDTEASLLLRIDLGAIARATNNLNQSLYDAGSFIRAFYHTDGTTTGKKGIGVTLWPLDTDRFRLGYLYDISWGGTNPFINQSIFPRIQGGAPGGKIELTGDNYTFFVGLKTATIVEAQEIKGDQTGDIEVVRTGQSNYGFLAGGSVDATENFRFDLGGGYFQQGRFDLPGIVGTRVYTAGLSGRVLLHDKDTPAPQSIDFALYRNDPNKPMIIFKPETYKPGKTTWSIAIEATNLWQNLKDFDAVGATATQSARAAAAQANIKSSYLRASFTAIYRDLPYVLRNQPSFIPFETLPKDAGSTDEFFLALASDYYFPKTRLTAGIGAGLQFPATFSTLTIDSASTRINRTVVVREQGNIAILPVNAKDVPIFQARVSLKWDVSSILSAMAWLQFVRDNNGTFVERDPTEGTLALRTFINPNFLGFGASASARF